MGPHSQNLEHFLVSGYTEHEGQPGIRRFALSADGNTATPCGELEGITSPSFCVLDDERLYAASETEARGGLAHCTMNGGVPVLADQVEFEPAAGTCFVLKHPHAHHLYGANYNSGSIASCALSERGALKGPVTIIQHVGHGAARKKSDPNFDRQTAPHVHTLSFVPKTNLLAAVDLGLDLIAIYQTDTDGTVIDADHEPVLNIWPHHLGVPESENDSPFYRAHASSIETAYFESAGTGHANHPHYCLERSIPHEKMTALAQLPVRPAAIVEVPLFNGPRIIAYHPNGQYAALICELACELIIFRLEADGLIWNPVQRWDLLQEAHAPIEGPKPPLAAHCEFSNDGRFLYASVRGTDQLIAFTLGQNCSQEGTFICSSNGGTPRHFALNADQTMLAVANQTGNDVALYRRDETTGTLEAITTIPCPTPSCIIWE